MEYEKEEAMVHRKLFFTSIAIFVLLCSSLAVSVEAASIMWMQTYDSGTSSDNGRCVIETSDGGYAIAGFAHDSGGKSDAWLVKTDANGNEQWIQNYGGTEWDEAYSVVQTSDGGYTLAGMTWSFGSAGGGDVWLVKTDASGVVQWNQTYSQSMDDNGYSMVQTSDGGYAIVGYTFYSTDPGSRDFWLVKTDANGNEQWNQNYGGTEWDEAYSVIQTSDGGYALAGYTKSFGEESGDFWLVKTDAAGVAQWNQTYGTTEPDTAHSVAETSDGGYAIVGDAGYSLGDDCDAWLVKTDAFGNELWNQTYGGTDHDYGLSVVETSDGGYTIAGSTESFGSDVGRSRCWLIRTDATGTMQWDQTYGGMVDQWDWDEGYCLVETSDGGYAIAGTHSSTLGTYKQDFWLIKTDEYGVVPEFSSLLIPLMFLTASAFVLVKKMKLFRKHS